MIITYRETFGCPLSSADFRRTISSYAHLPTLQDKEKSLYRLSFKLEGLSHRIYKISILFLKTIFSLGLYFLSSSFRAQWNSCLKNKTVVEMCWEEGTPLALLLIPHLSLHKITLRQIHELFKILYSPYCLSLGFNELKSIQLKTFPEGIIHFSKATYLKLNGHLLEALPDDLDKMSALTEINLSGNQFKEFPEILYKLPSGCFVKFESNPLDENARLLVQQKISAPEYHGPLIQLEKSHLKN